MHYPIMSAMQLAERWKVSLKILNRWRLDNVGPAWYQLCGHVRYHEADVLEFEQLNIKHAMTLLEVKRALEPNDLDETADPRLEDEPNQRYLSAHEISELTALPIQLFRDEAKRNSKRVPHLMLVGNLRFSLQATLEWELAHSERGSAGLARLDEAKAAALATGTGQAWQQHPARWSSQTRNWSLVAAVTLNPEHDSVIKSALANAHI